MRGLFVVVEGPDGAGKSTVSSLVVDALCAAGRRARREVEPTDGVVGKLIRQVLRGELSMDPLTLRCLFAADRYEHAEAIQAALARGITVVCDRYALSNVAYALAELGSEYATWAAELSRYCVVPDVTVVLEAPVEVCVARMRGRGAAAERFERADLQERIHRAYGEARTFAQVGAVEYVDATGSAEETAAGVMAIVERVAAERRA